VKLKVIESEEVERGGRRGEGRVGMSCCFLYDDIKLERRLNFDRKDKVYQVSRKKVDKLLKVKDNCKVGQKCRKEKWY
jgi:hypothetical protein